ncbi:hypothetical protein Tco_0140694 [Tanacetum coccineum]
MEKSIYRRSTIPIDEESVHRDRTQLELYKAVYFMTIHKLLASSATTLFVKKDREEIELYTSDVHGDNQDLRLQLAEERRARLELAEVVDGMRRGQEPRGVYYVNSKRIRADRLYYLVKRYDRKIMNCEWSRESIGKSGEDRFEKPDHNLTM